MLTCSDIPCAAVIRRICRSHRSKHWRRIRGLFELDARPVSTPIIQPRTADAVSNITPRQAPSTERTADVHLAPLPPQSGLDLMSAD